MALRLSRVVISAQIREERGLQVLVFQDLVIHRWAERELLEKVLSP